MRRLRAVTVKGIPAEKKIFPRMRKKGDGARKRKNDPMMIHRLLPRVMVLSACSWEHLQWLVRNRLRAGTSVNRTNRPTPAPRA